MSLPTSLPSTRTACRYRASRPHGLAKLDDRIHRQLLQRVFKSGGMHYKLVTAREADSEDFAYMNSIEAVKTSKTANKVKQSCESVTATRSTRRSLYARPLSRNSQINSTILHLMDTQIKSYFSFHTTLPDLTS